MMRRLQSAIVLSVVVVVADDHAVLIGVAAGREECGAVVTTGDLQLDVLRAAGVEELAEVIIRRRRIAEQRPPRRRRPRAIVCRTRAGDALRALAVLRLQRI